MSAWQLNANVVLFSINWLVLRYGDLCVLCLVGTGLLRILNLCSEGSELQRWYQFHLFLTPQASVVDNEILVLVIRSNFHTLVCLVRVSEENFMRYIEDFPKSCPATHRYVERCRFHLFGLISFTTFNAQFLYSLTIYITLQSSTCFEHQHAHLQEEKLYYHSIWYRHCL